MKVWLLIALALPTMAQAFTPTSQNDCSQVDLRTSTLAEVRNQKQMAWCYAFTGSDMLADTFDTPERISAADVAISYNQTRLGLFVRWFNLNVVNRKKPNIAVLAHQTGFNKVSLDRAMKEGWCPERIFPSESWTKMTKTAEGWTSSQVNLDQAMIQIGALHDVRKNLTASTLPYYFTFKNVGPEEFMDMLQTKNIAKFYEQLRTTACKDDRRPFPEKLKTTMVLKNSKLFKRISQQLDSGRLVGLDYDSRLLQDNTHRGVKLARLHTSSIVGRRWSEEKNSCEFLIRNSHGKGCGGYDSHYECDAGNIWIPESKIYPGAISVVYIHSH